MNTDTPRPSLLILDDEEMVLTSLRNLFRLQTEYEVIVHSSAREALESARTRPVDLVISDYLMPEMDGITFLGRFKEIQPQSIRVPSCCAHSRRRSPSWPRSTRISKACRPRS
ncbi:MAG: response regulator receiver protein [Acidobacteria bacterium]|nr:response regulator receiver protein [Acidobacteriota bacterium]